MIMLSQFLDKSDTRRRSEGERENMKNTSTYKLLVQSEEKKRNILETVIYCLVAASVIVSIWQFAEQPVSTTDIRVQPDAEVQIAS